MVVRVYNPLGMKRLQIVQSKGYFYITRCDLVWQLLAFWCSVYSYIQGMKLIGKIVSNDNQFTVILCSLLFHFIIALPFKYVHDNQRTLFFRITKFLFFGWQIAKDNDIKKTFALYKFDRLLVMNVTWKSDGNVNLGRHLFDLPWYIRCIKRKEPVAVTRKVAVICLLSSRPLMGTFFDLFWWKSVNFPEDTCDRGVWSRLRTSPDGILGSNMTPEFLFRK